MTAIEWILAGGVVALFWVAALYIMFTENDVFSDDDPDGDLIGNEIARWQEAFDRTDERQGIRRRR